MPYVAPIDWVRNGNTRAICAEHLYADGYHT